MKKVISPVIIILLLGFIGYDHKDFVIDEAQFLFNDPAEKVLNANIPESESIYQFDNESLGEIYLSAGNEEKQGFRHILATHTSQYFVNFKDKNNASMFDEDVSGKDILLGIKEFYGQCAEVHAFNREPQTNTTYLGFADFDGKNELCLLIVETQSKQIVTFYPFVEVQVQEEVVVPRYD